MTQTNHRSAPRAGMAAALTAAALIFSGGASAALLDAFANGGFEAWGSNNGDMLRIEIIDQDGNVHVLDQFSGWGDSLTGSQLCS